MNDKFIYVMCGIPGSGKTAMSKFLHENNDVAIHSYDDLVSADKKESSIIVYEKWVANILKSLDCGDSVVCDSTNLLEEERSRFLDMIKKYPHKKILIVMATPLAQCLERNKTRKNRLPDFVLQQAKQIFELPTLSEGWDDIQYYI